MGAAGLNTTLVLEPDLPDFSTDAGNSALIFKTISVPRSSISSETSDGAKTKATS
jgi:hypothetical protein